MGCNGCGSSSGDDRMKIVQGATYRRGFVWTLRDADGVQVPLDANDWTATLVIRRNLTYPTDIVTLTSDPTDGLALTTEDDSIKISVEMLSNVTAGLETGKDFRYTLALTNVADPDDVRVLVAAGYVDIKDTAL